MIAATSLEQPHTPNSSGTSSRGHCGGKPRRSPQASLKRRGRRPADKSAFQRDIEVRFMGGSQCQCGCLQLSVALLRTKVNDACKHQLSVALLTWVCPVCDGRSCSRCGSRRRKQLGTAQLPHHSTRSHSSQHSPSTRTRSRSWRRHQAQSNTRSRLLQQAGLSSALSRPRCCPTSRSQHCWPAAWAPRCHCRRHLLPPVATVMLV